MAERNRVLVSAPYMQPVLDRFRPRFEAEGVEVVSPPVRERMEESDLLPIIPTIDGVLCGDDRFTERVLQAAPRLKVISKWGTGIDSIDQVACKKFGIAVRNTPNAFTEPVADSVLGYLLNFARQLPWMDKSLKTGGWGKMPGKTLGESTLGIVGFGNIGRAVARRAAAFNMEVLVNDVVEIPADVVSRLGVKVIPFDELLSRSDFVSVNCDLNPTSFHLIDERALSLMKPTAVFVNAARGPIHHEPALIAALQSGKLAGAGLDVFEDEPLPLDSPLRRMDNVMLAAHNSNSSPRAWERVHENTLKNLFEELRKWPVAGLRA